LYNQEKEHDERIKAKNQQIAKAKDQREAALKDLAIAKAGESSKSSLRETMQTRMTSLEARIPLTYRFHLAESVPSGSYSILTAGDEASQATTWGAT